MSEEEKKAVETTKKFNAYLAVLNEENILYKKEDAIQGLVDIYEKQYYKISSKDKEIKLLKEFHNELVEKIDKLEEELEKLKLIEEAHRIENGKLREEVKKYKESSDYIYEQYQDIGKMYFDLKEKLQELLDNNLEKENNKYIVDSNACQCLVRHLINLLEEGE